MAQAQRLEAVAAAGAAGEDLWEGSDAEAEAQAVKERISELKRRQMSGELSEAEIRSRRMSRLACMCSPRRGFPTGELSEAEIRSRRMSRLACTCSPRRGFPTGELSDAEKAELTKSEAKLGRLEGAMSSALIGTDWH